MARSRAGSRVRTVSRTTIFQGSDEPPWVRPGITRPFGAAGGAAYTHVGTATAASPIANHLPKHRVQDCFILSLASPQRGRDSPGREDSVTTVPSCSRANSSRELPVPPTRNSWRSNSITARKRRSPSDNVSHTRRRRVLRDFTARWTHCHKYLSETAQAVSGGDVAWLAALASITFVPSPPGLDRRFGSNHFRHPDR